MRLWGEYDLVKDTESYTDSDWTVGDGAPFPVHGAVMEGLESDVKLDSDSDEFDMITSDADVAIERAKVLPENVLQDQDDIAKATAFRFVALHHINKQTCVCLTASLVTGE